MSYKYFETDYFFDITHYSHKDLFKDITYVWEALDKRKAYFEKFPLGEIQTKVPEGVHLINPEQIFIGKGTVLEPTAYIHGPCIIGENCTVRHGAYIRGGLITGNNCVIGHDTEIKDSILLNDVHAAHFNYVGNTILGNKVNLGAGYKFANLRFDNKEVIIYLDNQKFKTGMRKLGGIVGDNTQLGCNAVSNPGTLIGKDVMWYPCTNFGGFIPSTSTVRSEVAIVSP
jgi:NDP-sugar pyrophosphorylase family protein